MSVWALFSIKGGVGKTSSAVNLAYIASRAGARTLIWDLDPQGAATFVLRESIQGEQHGKRIIQGKRSVSDYLVRTNYPGLDLIQADLALRYADLLIAKGDRPRRRLAQILSPLRARYDRIYLDCPPGLTLTAESIFRAADALLVPTIPAPLAIRAVEQLVEYVDHHPKVDALVAPFFSMVDNRKAAHRQIVTDEIAGGRYLDASVPYSTVVEQMGVRRAPVTAFTRRHVAARAYRTLWRAAEDRFQALRR
ncbi:MAG: ParA family protein [Pseudomonadota bacterium]